MPDAKACFEQHLVLLLAGNPSGLTLRPCACTTAGRLHQQKKGLFSGLFGKKAAANPPPPLAAPQRPGAAAAAAAGPGVAASGASVSAPTGTVRYQSATATAAAARWLGRGTAAADGGGGAAALVGDTTSSKASLLASRVRLAARGCRYCMQLGTRVGRDGLKRVSFVRYLGTVMNAGGACPVFTVCRVGAGGSRKRGRGLWR